MSDFPQHAGLPLFIHPWTQFSVGIEGRQVDGVLVPVAFTWTANQAVYIPFSIPWAYPVRRMFWINGSTITTSNADAGIYSEGGHLLFSTGSTALSGASVVQYAAPTTVGVLPPGRYYLAYTCSNTTSRAFAISLNAAQGKCLGLLTQATALPLPSSATFATYAGVGLPVVGFTKNASGF